MPIGNAAGENILNAEFRGDTFVKVASFWIGFRSNGTELTNGDSPGYERAEIVVEAASFDETTTTMIHNAIAFNMPPTGTASADWLEADEVVLYDAETVGNVRYSGLLDQPFQLRTGQKRSFAAGAFRVRFI